VGRLDPVQHADAVRARVPADVRNRGLTGLPLGLNITDIPLHDTYYVIGHFHYVVAPGTIFALFAGIYYWYPKATGRSMSETLGKLHFWPSFICMNGIFMPMFITGMAGMSRRLADGGATYAFAKPVLHYNQCRRTSPGPSPWRRFRSSSISSGA
jgi:heme/copper-type cytochrome/quinol oxidase subunit 1